MKKWLMTGAALLMAASIASAGDPSGINLSWDDCGISGASTTSFACDVNTGAPLTLVGSFTPPANINQFLGIAAQIDITVGTQLPDWWKHGSALCRGTTGLATSFDFTSGPFTCTDVFAGQAAGGFAYDAEFSSPSRARMRIQAAIPAGTEGPVIVGTQYYAFKANILKSKTLGGGSCAGCISEACIVFNSIQLFQPLAAANDPIITTEEDRNWVTYQNLAILDCPASTPTRNTTWGRVKSLYR